MFYTMTHFTARKVDKFKVPGKVLNDWSFNTLTILDTLTITSWNKFLPLVKVLNDPTQFTAYYEDPFHTLNIVTSRSPYLFYRLTVGVEVVCLLLITLIHTPHLLGLLWTRDRLVAETSAWQQKHCTKEKHPCPLWDWKPLTQQALGRRHTP
jgi:hypothetical protein